MKLKPLADRVVLKQNAAEERTASGIYLTSAAQEKPEVYEVVEVGPGGVVEGQTRRCRIHHRASERHPGSD